MQETTNKKLKKIELTDAPPDITVLNDNWDTIDEELQSATDHENNDDIHVTADNKANWNSKANGSHNHSASNITSGTLGVARGGTGRATLTSDYFLRGNGTSAVKLSSPSDALIDMGGALGGTGYVDDLNTCHYRGLYACNSSTKNSPFAGYGVCISVPYWAGVVSARKQLFIVHGDNMTIWQRTGAEDGTWTAWTKNHGSSFTQETGTWTPELDFPYARYACTYNTQRGSYVKTGKVITISWLMRFSTTSGWLETADYPYIKGMPYTPAGTHHSSMGNTVIIPNRGSTSPLSFIAKADNNRIAIQEQNGANLRLGTDMYGSFYFDGSITYQTY